MLRGYYVSTVLKVFLHVLTHLIQLSYEVGAIIILLTNDESKAYGLHN